MSEKSLVIFVDSSVLIAAVRGVQEVSEAAMQILETSNATFASSAFVRLEVLPKALAFKRQDEVAFYKTFFDAVSIWTSIDDALVSTAFEEASRLGLSAVDALHLAAAKSAGADIFVTAESTSKPLHKTDLVTVHSIRPIA